MSSETSLRQEEKKLLFTLHDQKASGLGSHFKVRFQRKEKIKSVGDKVYTLLQGELGCFLEEHLELKKYKSEITRLLRLAVKMSRGLLDFLLLPNILQEKGFQTVKNAILLQKVFRRGIWDNSPYVVKQFDGVGPAISAKLVRDGHYTSIDSIAKANDRSLEGVASKKSPWGQTIIDMAKALPDYKLLVRQKSESFKECRVVIQLFLANRTYLQERIKSGKNRMSKKLSASKMNPSTIVLVGNADDRILAFQKFSDDSLISSNGVVIDVIVPKAENSPQNKFFVGVFNDSWIGIDINRVDYEVRFSSLSSLTDRILQPTTRGQLNTVSMDFVKEDEEEEETMAVRPSLVSQSQASGSLPMACNHRCHNKNICSHSCCKTATQVVKWQASQSVCSFKRPLEAPGSFKKLRFSEILSDSQGGSSQIQEKQYPSDQTQATPVIKLEKTPLIPLHQSGSNMNRSQTITRTPFSTIDFRAGEPQHSIVSSLFQLFPLI
jgi:hypothetical protein